MIVLVDADVLLDVALDRAPFADEASVLLDRLERGPSRGVVAWHTLSNFYYLVSPRRGRADARRFIADLCRFLDVAPVTSEHARLAVESPLKDFEDAMQVAAALAAGAEVIATRNVKDFKRSPVPAITPREVIARLV